MANISEFRPFLEHFEASHRRLTHVLNEAEEAMRAAPCRVDVGALWDHLDVVRDELSRHFHEELEGSCLEEAMCRCPSLAPHVSELLKEHQQLLENVHLLMARITQSNELQPGELVDEFVAMARKVRAHEAAEHEILAKAFGMSLLSDDQAT